MKQTEYIYHFENTLGSIVSDLFTFGFIALTFWFNKEFINGNDLVDVILLVMFVLFLTSKSKTRRFKNKQELIEYLNKKEV